jgi:hypothetical protein
MAGQEDNIRMAGVEAKKIRFRALGPIRFHSFVAIGLWRPSRFARS